MAKKPGSIEPAVPRSMMKPSYLTRKFTQIKTGLGLPKYSVRAKRPGGYAEGGAVRGGGLARKGCGKGDMR